MRTRVVLGLCGLLACSKPAAPGPTVEGREARPTYQLGDNWGDSACVPRGDERTVLGRIEVKPFGKGTDGAMLVEDGGRSWVISYRAEEPILGLRGKRVEARGRACDKQFEAIAGPHFDMRALTVR